MSYWIFKIIYYLIFVILFMCAAFVIAFIFKDVGWEQPFRWFLIIGFIAYLADIFVN